ncbi:MAG: anthranilate phosphoribosyltransferase [Dehalococcoidia bacterium]
MNIQQAIQAVVECRDLSVDDAAAAMSQIMDGEATPAQFGAFVTALRMKGETPEEIAGMARVMREKSLHVDIDAAVVDTCGTGGDGMGWFNVSTAAAFVVAGAGVPVAKHGNRAMSGATGSADVLEAMGVKIDLGPDGVKRCIDDAGIGFMFAQAFHPAMKYAGPPRREIGIRTVFNLLGPLTNPAGTRRQVIGIADAVAAEKIAKALSILGTDYTLVVHAESGADEMDIEGHTLMYQVTPDAMKRRRTRPADFSLPEGSRDHLVARSVEESVGMIRGVLAGKGGGHNAPPSRERSARNVVVMNAAAALLVSGKAVSFQDASGMAVESIDSGAASDRLARLAALSQELS